LALLLDGSGCAPGVSGLPICESPLISRSWVLPKVSPEVSGHILHFHICQPPARMMADGPVGTIPPEASTHRKSVECLRRDVEGDRCERKKNILDTSYIAMIQTSFHEQLTCASRGETIQKLPLG
jgi:hypothetical protein